jgi:hypothetical protein
MIVLNKKSKEKELKIDLNMWKLTLDILKASSNKVAAMKVPSNKQLYYTCFEALR